MGICTSTRPQLLHLVIYHQGATDFLTCLGFFPQRMPLFHIFQFYFALTEASTFHFISQTELKISLTWNFLESYLVTQAVGLKHVRTWRRKTVVKDSGSMVFSCFHTTSSSKANPSIVLKDSSPQEDFFFQEPAMKQYKIINFSTAKKRTRVKFLTRMLILQPIKIFSYELFVLKCTH